MDIVKRGLVLDEELQRAIWPAGLPSEATQALVLLHSMLDREDYPLARGHLTPGQLKAGIYEWEAAVVYEAIPDRSPNDLRYRIIPWMGSCKKPALVIQAAVQQAGLFLGDRNLSTEEFGELFSRARDWAEHEALLSGIERYAAQAAAGAGAYGDIPEFAVLESFFRDKAAEVREQCNARAADFRSYRDDLFTAAQARAAGNEARALLERLHAARAHLAGSLP